MTFHQLWFWTSIIMGCMCIVDALQSGTAQWVKVLDLLMAALQFAIAGWLTWYKPPGDNPG